MCNGHEVTGRVHSETLVPVVGRLGLSKLFCTDQAQHCCFLVMPREFSTSGRITHVNIRVMYIPAGTASTRSDITLRGDVSLMTALSI